LHASMFLVSQLDPVSGHSLTVCLNR
jgi:hypothetical protein